MHFYALWEPTIRSFVARVRDITSGKAPELWPALFKTIEGFRPPSTLVLGRGLTPPYSRVSYYASPALGWPDLTADSVPTWGDQRLDWVVRNMILGTSQPVLIGRDTRFSYTFAYWLRDQNAIQGQAEEEEHKLFCDRVFYSQEPFPEDLAFLAPEGHRAYLAPTDVAALLAKERAVGLLANVADRMERAGYGPIVGTEVRRLHRLLEFIEADGSALLYSEEAT